MNIFPANPNFERSLQFVLDAEGGFSNDKNDRGGKTNKGIIQKEYDEYRDNRQEDRRSVKEISDDEVEDIYYNQYWVQGKCYKLPWPLCAVHFDGCVNTGVGQAGKFLQRAVGAKDDGAVGPNTIKELQNKLNDVGVEAICNNIIEQRDGFYKLLAQLDSTQKDFSNGWSNRLKHLKEYIV